MKKILVIGASIAGPTVCYWLKTLGFSPTLIEKNKSLRTGGYAIDIRGIAIDVAKKMGIYEQICAQRTQLEFGRHIDAAGNVLSEEEGEQYGVRQGEDVEIVRGDLVSILMQTIPDVPCYFNQSVEHIEQHDMGVTVLFHDGRKECYDLVIAADGLHSSTRRKVFDPEEYKLLHLGAYISVFSIPNYLKLSKCGVLFTSQQKSVHVSSDRDASTALVGLMFRAHQHDIRDEEEQKNFLRTTFTDLGWETNKLLTLMDQADDFYFDSITQVKMNDWTKGRVVLMGDAGYCASPLSGQGTSLALVGAYLLAHELKAAGEDYRLALERYNNLMHPFVAANQDFGYWVSETYMREEELSKAVIEERSNKLLEKIHHAAHAITLPDYDGPI